MIYEPASDRYERGSYRRVGRSGLLLPAISLGLWHNFGGQASVETARAMLRRAFDLGVPHFDLANNYGPPPGSAETLFGRILAEDFRAHRDEMIVSSKAGYLMWPGPYGQWGSRKYLLASLDQSLQRLGLDYVDIFYSHRFDPDTPLEETMGALAQAVRSGKALYVGISNSPAAETARAAALLRGLGTPCLIHQSSFSMINRTLLTSGTLEAIAREAMGCICFSPMAQGMLTERYLGGLPADSRAATGGALPPAFLTPDNLRRIRELDLIAERRGQSLAQMALAWVLRDPRITSALIGASSVAQIEDCVGATANTSFTAEELAAIDALCLVDGVDLWTRARADATRSS